jgi:hypothetical protein
MISFDDFIEIVDKKMMMPHVSTLIALLKKLTRTFY